MQFSAQDLAKFYQIKVTGAKMESKLNFSIKVGEKDF